MFHHKPICFITILIVCIGGLNWGLCGIGKFFNKDTNILHLIFKSYLAVEWAIYLLVGIASVALLYSAIKYGKYCACNKINGKK
jgi:uncharacterized membrane protein YuzA (DUF378 family)